jgi:hypothetical protein
LRLTIGRMAHTLAFMHDTAALELARIAIVLVSALSLIAAGRALPF